MSLPMTVDDRPKLALYRRPAPILAMAIARVLARMSPRRFSAVLRFVRRGAAPATYDGALAARSDVMAVSSLCAGQYCLQRSLATALLCRLRGSWPEWCAGVHTQPFAAHAWIQVDGQPVGEPHALTDFHLVMTVGPIAAS